MYGMKFSYYVYTYSIVEYKLNHFHFKYTLPEVTNGIQQCVVVVFTVVVSIYVLRRLSTYFQSELGFQF